MMLHRVAFVVLGGLLLALPACDRPRESIRFSVEHGEGTVVIQGSASQLTIHALGPDGEKDSNFDWLRPDIRFTGLADTDGTPILAIESTAGEVGGSSWQVVEGALRFENVFLDDRLLVRVNERDEVLLGRVMPGWMSVLPPLIAIVLAIVLRQVLLALFLGICVGMACIVGDPIGGFITVVTDLIPSTIGGVDGADRIKIVIFSTLLGGVVAMIARMGGTRALVASVTRFGDTRRGAQSTTWLAGMLIFFDDYANALLVGSTMRPITDRFRISREKLSYLVDTTAAPVACVCVISTWIAAEIGYIQVKLESSHLQEATGLAANSAYQVFLATIPYNFYPILSLVFAAVVVYTQRDFGPMLKAERRAFHEGKLLADGARPLSSAEMDDLEPADPNKLRAVNAIVPILVVVASVVGGLWFTGSKSFADESRRITTRLELLEPAATDSDADADADAVAALRADLAAAQSPSVRDVLGNANSYFALMIAAFLGVTVAILLAIGQRLMGIGECLDTVTAGIKAMIPAVLVLIMAWTLQAVCERAGTSQWLIAHVSFTLEFLPAAVFILAAAIAFATGTSWGTMGILIPLTMDYAVALAVRSDLGVAESQTSLVGAVAAVLAGAVFGDHCSPISDTTIMSSMSSGADHVDHVRTQMPYALVVAFIALAVGYVPAGFGMSPWISLALGVVAVAAVVRIVGRRVGDAAPGADRSGT